MAPKISLKPITAENVKITSIDYNEKEIIGNAAFTFWFNKPYEDIIESFYLMFYYAKMDESKKIDRYKYINPSSVGYDPEKNQSFYILDMNFLEAGVYTFSNFSTGNNYSYDYENRVYVFNNIFDTEFSATYTARPVSTNLDLVATGSTQQVVFDINDDVNKRYYIINQNYYIGAYPEIQISIDNKTYSGELQFSSISNGQIVDTKILSPYNEDAAYKRCYYRTILTMDPHQQKEFQVTIPANNLIKGDHSIKVNVISTNEKNEVITDITINDASNKGFPDFYIKPDSSRFMFSEDGQTVTAIVDICNYGNAGTGAFEVAHGYVEKRADGTYAEQLEEFGYRLITKSLKGVPAGQYNYQCTSVEYGGIPYDINKEWAVLFGLNKGDIKRIDEINDDNNELTVMVGYKKILEDAKIIEGGEGVNTGKVVANSILHYLNNESTEIEDTTIDMNIMSQILNNNTSWYYNFGSTKDLISMGKIDMDAEEGEEEPDTTRRIREKVNTWICHWIDYDVKYAPSDKPKNVPVAVAIGDYDDWRMVYGFRTSWDPFITAWKIPDGIQLDGFYLRSPKKSDQEYYEYYQSYTWNDDVFKALKTETGEGDNIFAIVVEPPEQEIEGTLIPAPPVKDKNVANIFETNKWGYSYYKPWELLNEYNKEIYDTLVSNSDFIKALEDENFNKSIQDTMVSRMFKVESNDNYALIPFDKKVDDKLVSPMIIVSGLDGSFKRASARPSSTIPFQVKSRWDAMNEIQVQTKREVINNWLSLNATDSLMPVYKSVTFGQTEEGYFNTIVHISNDNEVKDINVSPEIIAHGSYKKGTDTIYCFEISDSDGQVNSVQAGAYEINAVQDSLYELIVPDSTTDDAIEIEVTDNENKGSLYAGGYSFYYLVLNQ